MSKSLSCLLTLAFAVSTVTSASAGPVIFSTFGPGLSYDSSSGQTLSYETFLGETRITGVSVAFTPTTNVELGSVSVAIEAPLDFTITVAQNEDWSGLGGTDGAGAALESFPVSAETSAGVVTVTSVTNPELLAGDTYWVEITPNSDWDSSIEAPITGTWFNTDQSLTAPVSVYDDFCELICPPLTQTETAPAVQVTSFVAGTSVPEPSAALMLAIGVLSILGGRLAGGLFDARSN